MENNKAISRWFEQPQSQQKETPPSVLGLTAAIADFMVWLTILSERRPNRRAARRAMVISRWLQLSGDSLKVPFPGVVLI